MDKPVIRFDALNFDNCFVAELPVDPICESYSFPVKGALFSRVQPRACSQPSLLTQNLDGEAFVQAMSGNQLATAMDIRAAKHTKVCWKPGPDYCSWWKRT